MTQTVEDPFATDADTDDPFATPEDVRPGSGSFLPKPSLAALEGRMVAMIPRKFEDDAPLPEQYREPGGKTVRDRYTVDMYVLDGGELRYFYTERGQNGAADTEKEQVIPASDLPVLFADTWRVEQSIIGQLRKVDGSQRPILMGIVRRGPKAAERRAGATFESVEAAFVAWEQKPARTRGNPPAFSWQIDLDVPAERRAVALDWWKRDGMGIQLR